MRTVKTIEKEAEKALREYNDHYNNCPVCQNSPTCAKEEMFCFTANFLYDEYDNLISEADYAEQIFQAELRERKME